ncbi:oligogalacturonate-specific porin KdgM family protein [Halomonas dongshanensis]|uniref:Oligogalacturonate-specific porin KdgM family protein n=1 Tax=Halomonas dongshanensis TaxID=2890835 RepID=A0ABT2EAQ2_9GAMM|nr:oligogalacturonate-specific porin KdgM family protein [Halomonas dongshanensis]MCS2608651.1 oligogalacturonate-specific porin KdgM family protein [Halomonas dongshanensis]
MKAFYRVVQASSLAVTCTAFSLALPAWAADNILTMKLEQTTNDHALTLPKIAITRVFDDSSSLMFEKSWFWQDGVHDSGWPKHDEAFVNYSFPRIQLDADERWSLTPQVGAKFRSNVTRALAGVRLGYRGDGWGLAGRYRYEHDTTHETAIESRAGRIDLYATYNINENWELLYNPHYHFKHENSSPNFGTGNRDYFEQEFLMFNHLNANNTIFGGYVQRDRNSDEATTDPGQRNSSWLIGYQYKF